MNKFTPRPTGGLLEHRQVNLDIYNQDKTRLERKIIEDVYVVIYNPKTVPGDAYPMVRGSWPGLYGTVRVDISIETAPSGYEELARELNALVEKHEEKLEILRRYNE